MVAVCAPALVNRSGETYRAPLPQHGPPRLFFSPTDCFVGDPSADNPQYYGSPFSTLIANASLAWSAFGSPPPSAPSDAFPIKSAGGGGALCQAAPPDTSGMNVPGTVFNGNCSVFSPNSWSTFSVARFSVMWSLPAGSPSWGIAGVSPAVPSPSATPSATPSASATPPPAQPGVVTWLPATSALSGVLVAGRENGGSIWVCRGTLPTGDVLPGKYEPSFYGCDVPYNGIEFVDGIFSLLGASPYLVWSSRPVAGGVPVVAGAYLGANVSICRAYQAAVTPPTGPHSGYLNLTYTTTWAPVSGSASPSTGWTPSRSPSGLASSTAGATRTFSWESIAGHFLPS